MPHPRAFSLTGDRRWAFDPRECSSHFDVSVVEISQSRMSGGIRISRLLDKTYAVHLNTIMRK
jgi:hypothetical protein